MATERRDPLPHQIAATDQRQGGEHGRCPGGWRSDTCADDRREERVADDVLPDWPDEWLMIERERYRQLRLHALDELCVLHASSGRYARAVAAGLASVSSEPTRGVRAPRADDRAHARGQPDRKSALDRLKLLTDDLPTAVLAESARGLSVTVAASSPLAKRMASLSVADVALTSRDAFVASALVVSAPLCDPPRFKARPCH